MSELLVTNFEFVYIQLVVKLYNFSEHDRLIIKN